MKVITVIHWKAQMIDLKKPTKTIERRFLCFVCYVENLRTENLLTIPHIHASLGYVNFPRTDL